MTLMGICGRCAEEKPLHVPHERRRLTRGPDGEKLCPRHAREAWNNRSEDRATEGSDDDLRTDGGCDEYTEVNPQLAAVGVLTTLFGVLFAATNSIYLIYDVGLLMPESAHINALAISIISIPVGLGLAFGSGVLDSNGD